MSIAADLSVDRELAALLITLAPLGERGLSFVKVREREFASDAALDQPWSTGERALIVAARSLWRGTPEKVDLAYLATLSGTCFAAVVNGIAAYRGMDFNTDWAAALDEVTS